MNETANTAAVWLRQKSLRFRHHSWSWLAIAALSGACSDERDTVATEVEPAGSSSLDWREALEAMEAASNADYSYVIWLSNNEASQFAYGASLLIGLDDQPGACAASEEGAVGDGWWLSLTMGDLEGGTYAGEWRKNQGVSELSRSVSVSFERRSGDSVQHYAVFSAKLTLDAPVTEYERNSEAQDVTGHLQLVLPSTPVWELECRATAVVGEQDSVSAECDCLVGESSVETCYPESGNEVCCTDVVTSERITFEIPFRAKPCAGLCAYSSLVSPSMCASLKTSGFNDTTTP